MELSKRKEGISLKYLVIKAQKGDAQAFIELIEQINCCSLIQLAANPFCQSTVPKINNLKSTCRFIHIDSKS